MGFDRNSNQSNSYSEEDFMVQCSNVSNNFDNTWKAGLELYDDEQTIFSSGPNGDFIANTKYMQSLVTRQKNLTVTTTQSSTQQTSKEEQTTRQRETPQNLY
jgi:hypothetical protein